LGRKRVTHLGFNGVNKMGQGKLVATQAVRDVISLLSRGTKLWNPQKCQKGRFSKRTKDAFGCTGGMKRKKKTVCSSKGKSRAKIYKLVSNGGKGAVKKDKKKKRLRENKGRGILEGGLGTSGGGVNSRRQP